MKVVIAGSRTITNYLLLKETIAKSNYKITEIISGGAKGVDELANRYAYEHKIPITVIYADWDTHGKSAGFKRNLVLATLGDALIALWDGKSPGTKHMINCMGTKPKFYLIYPR